MAAGRKIVVAADPTYFTFKVPEAKGKVTKKADNDRLAIALALEKLIDREG